MPPRSIFENLEPRSLRSGGQPVVTIGDAAAFETNTGQTAVSFIVRLSAPVNRTTEIHYATADGTATAADNDYVPTSGVVKFAPGETLQRITVLVNGDGKLESSETFVVNLFSTSRVTIRDGQGTFTILDDDVPPSSDPLDPGTGGFVDLYGGW